MLRGLFDAGGLFLLPFAGYFVFLLARRRYPFVMESWSRGPVAALVVTGLALAVGGVLLGGLFAPRHLGSYVPARIERGTLQPGHIE